MNLIRREFLLLRHFTTSPKRCASYSPVYEGDKLDPNALVDFEDQFHEIPKNDRTKNNFHAAIEFFRASRGARGRGHVEFINAALKNLKDFGLHKDLDTYKALLNIFPKGVMIPTNVWQKMFMHYPVQQVCCVDILDEMEYNGVQIDKEVHQIVVNAFGEYTHAGKKAKRMLYWMPKLKNTNNYLDRRLVENKNLSEIELARLALKMICRDSGTILTNLNVERPGVSSIFHQWIMSAQSPLQRRMLHDLPVEKMTFNIDGPRFVYVMDKRVEYAMMTAAPLKPVADETFVDQRTFQDYGEDLHERLFDLEMEANMHEQANETILALCCMETYTSNMASAWLHYLQKKNPRLQNSNVLIRIKEEERGMELVK